MKITEQDVYALQIATYLVKSHGYQFVKTNSNSNEIWLANPKAKYPAVHVTSATVESSFFDQERQSKIFGAILSIIKAEGPLLNIHISNENIEDNDSDFEEVAISESHYSGIDLSAEFPELKNQLHSTGDVAKDYMSAMKSTETVAKEITKKKQSLKEKIVSLPRVSAVLMVICILVYIASFILIQKYEDDVAVSIVLGALYKEFVFINHDYWRFLTCGFVHVSALHLFMNMVCLIRFGRVLEPIYGKWRYLAIILGSVVTGSACVYIMQSNSLTLGLSGGLYGLMGAYLIYLFDSGLYRNPQILNATIRLLAMNLLISIIPGVSLYGHLGGFLGGILITICLSPSKRFKQMRIHSVIALCLSVLLLGYKCYGVKQLDRVYGATDLQTIDILDDLGLTFYSDPLYENCFEYYYKQGLLE